MWERTGESEYFVLIRRIAIVVLIILLGFSVYLASAQSPNDSKLPMPFGIGVAVVLSSSMEPTLSVNDVVVVRKSGSYDVGDIVVYDNGKELVVHKIIKKDGDKITTRGEANLVADEPIGAEAVMGKVVLTLPNVGVVVNAICSPIGVIFIILAVVLIAEIVFLHQREKANRIEEINEIIKLGE